MMTSEEAISVLKETIDPNVDKSFKEWKEWDKEKHLPAVHMAIEALKQEPRKGEWVGLDECSVCGKQAYDFIDGCVEGVEYLPNFCPNCGADMRGDQRTGEWIPFSERFPREYAQYLVCFKSGECLVYWLEDSDWSRGIVEKEGIIAWMPLPEPYKGCDSL